MLFPVTLAVVTLPKLGVLLKEHGNGKVLVADMPDNSFVREDSIRAGDVLVAVDSVQVQTPDDVRMTFFKGSGTTG